MEHDFVLSLKIGNLVRQLDGEVKRAARALGGEEPRVLRLEEKRTGSA
jgi:hypothetical protein